MKQSLSSFFWWHEKCTVLKSQAPKVSFVKSRNLSWADVVATATVPTCSEWAGSMVEMMGEDDEAEVMER